MTVPSESDSEDSGDSRDSHSGDSGSYDGGYNINYQPSKWEKRWVTLPNSTVRVFKWVKVSEEQSVSTPQRKKEEYEIYNELYGSQDPLLLVNTSSPSPPRSIDSQD